MLPPLWICRHHVDVALKQQRSGYAVAGQPGYEIGAAMNFVQDLVLDAGVVQQGLDVFDALDFVARRVGGVETHPPLSQGDGIQIGRIGRGIGGHGYSGQ